MTAAGMESPKRRETNVERSKAIPKQLPFHPSPTAILPSLTIISDFGEPIPDFFTIFARMELANQFRKLKPNPAGKTTIN